MYIQTIRLKIRPFTINDLMDIHKYASNPQTTKYMIWGPNTLEETEHFLKQTLLNYQKNPITNYEYGIEYDGKIIGGIGLFIDYIDKSAEIGWILNEDYHRRGIMFEAAQEMIELAKSLGVEKLHATADSRNLPSFKLMEKLGMKRQKEKDQIRYNKETKQNDLIQVYYELDLK